MGGGRVGGVGGVPMTQEHERGPPSGHFLVTSDRKSTRHPVQGEDSEHLTSVH